MSTCRLILRVKARRAQPGAVSIPTYLGTNRPMNVHILCSSTKRRRGFLEAGASDIAKRLDLVQRQSFREQVGDPPQPMDWREAARWSVHTFLSRVLSGL